MKLTLIKLLPVFIIAVILYFTAVRERAYLDITRNGVIKKNLVEILLTKEELNGMSLETIGFLSDFSPDFYYLFLDKERKSVNDFSSSIAIMGENHEIHSYIKLNCLNSWVRIKGRLIKNDSPFYTADYIMLINEISGQDTRDNDSC